MRDSIATALEQCFQWMKAGQAPELCLARYPDLRQKLEPLLYTARFIASVPKVVPSNEFRNASKARLISRAREYSNNKKNEKSLITSLFKKLTPIWETLKNPYAPPGRAYRPLMATLFILLAISLATYSIPMFSAPGSSLESQCTLSVLSGTAEVQMRGSDNWQVAMDGVVLEAGTRVRTTEEAQAVLTFFEGTTIKLESGTDVEVEKVKGSDGQPTEIVLKQWLGKTWSRVVKKIDPGSRYEIKTPSAYALVRGTMFETEVDEEGATEVRTTEGTVSVGAQDEEVEVSAGLEAGVVSGAAPSKPMPIPPANSEFVVFISMPAVASVCDPNSSSTGYMPNGISFNQISGSQSSSPTEGDQVIRIPEPIAGIYKVVLRGINDGTTRVIYRAVSGSETVLEQTAHYEIKEGDEWLVQIELSFEGDQLISALVGDIELLTDGAPENIVTTELAAEAAVPIRSVKGFEEPVELKVRSMSGGSVIVPGEGDFIYEKGAQVSLVANAQEGYNFLGWDGAVASPSSPNTTITLNEDEVVTARFGQGNIHVVSIISTEGGSVIEPGQGVYMLEWGDTITLIAEPRAGWEFNGWEGPVADPSSPITTLTVRHAEDIVALFVPAR